MRQTILLGALLAATAVSAHPINATQPPADIHTIDTVSLDSNSLQNCRKYTMQGYGYTPKQGKPLASTADCEKLSLALLGQPQNYSLAYFQDNDDMDVEARGSCHLFVSTKMCDDGRKCHYDYPIKLGNGDVALLVGNALEEFGANGWLTARGTMECDTDDREEGDRTADVIWEIRDNFI
ncbi:hypothetical protein PG985_004374 [Apiospora marii]|uniref:uncharacterized protein n=1 Tax=Apiospora marii TaxID=335849 RepID=UPI00312DD257